LDQPNLGYALAVKIDYSALDQGVADPGALEDSFKAAIAAHGGGE